MRDKKLITVINGATWVQLLVLVLVHCCIGSVNGIAQTPSADPCEASPCGKGAECKSMGSIAICVCPNNNKGDPFVACMQEANEAELMKPSSSSAPSSASVHHQARSNPTSITTPKPTTAPSTKRVSLITSSTTPGPSTTTTSTTRSPFVHVFQTTTDRPSSSTNFGYSHDNQNPSTSTQGNRHGETNNIFPDSHRIPIISNNSPGSGHYPQHEYLPRPISDDGRTPAPPPYVYRGSATPTNTYDIFNEKTVGSPEYGITNSYPYRGSASSGHYSGGQSVYEYDSRPITYPHHSSHHHDRFAHHSYHPTTSGFPAPITESSASRYSHSGPIAGGSTYDIYNYNQLRNDIVLDRAHSSSREPAYSRIPDPLGKYENCRMVNGMVVCADNSNPFPYNHHQYHNNYHSHNPPRGDYMTPPSTNYGFQTNRDRDHFSSYYPSRHTSTTPYNYNFNHRQGYPDHGPRYPIDTTERYHHPFHTMEQKISSQQIISITPSASSSSSNDPLCQKMCGINSVCRLVLDRPVCGCPEGHTGDASVRCDPITGYGRGMRRDKDAGMEDGSIMGAQCEKHVECKPTEICAKNQCLDPCKHQDQIVAGSSSVKIASDTQYKTSICGSNAECLVVGHTPVCKCNDGYFGNPYVACVP